MNANFRQGLIISALFGFFAGFVAIILSNSIVMGVATGLFVLGIFTSMAYIESKKQVDGAIK